MSCTDPGRLRLAPVRTRGLDRTPRLLPRDLPAERTLVLIAYRQQHQRDVDAWIEIAVAHGVPPTPRGAQEPMRTAVIEVPFLSGRWLPARRLIDGGMARGIADPDVLARTLTAYGAPARHRRACGLDAVGARGDAVEALVSDRDGAVHWHASGPPQGAAPRGMLAALGLDDPSATD